MPTYLAKLGRTDGTIHYQRPGTNKTWCNTIINVDGPVGPASDYPRCQLCTASVRVIGAIQSALTSTSDQDEAELAFDVLMAECKPLLRRLTT
jgi:hypothetical protein